MTEDDYGKPWRQPSHRTGDQSVKVRRIGEGPGSLCVLSLKVFIPLSLFRFLHRTGDCSQKFYLFSNRRLMRVH